MAGEKLRAIFWAETEAGLGVELLKKLLLVVIGMRVSTRQPGGGLGR